MDPDAAPVLYIAVNADKPIREVTEVADKQVRRRIENIPGVGQVLLLGGAQAADQRLARSPQAARCRPHRRRRAARDRPAEPHHARWPASTPAPSS